MNYHLTCTTLPLPAEVIHDSTGAILYVAVTHGVAIVDAASNALITTIPTGVGSGIIGMSLAGDGSRLYVWDINFPSIVVINALTKAVVARVFVSGGFSLRGTAVNPQTGSVYATDGSKVTIIDPNTNTVVRTVSVSGLPGSLGY